MISAPRTVISSDSIRVGTGGYEILLGVAVISVAEEGNQHCRQTRRRACRRRE
jgi:hypothetical protein